MSGLGRTLFLVFAAAAAALVIGSTACTRRGGNGVVPSPSPTPITTYYVDPVKGKDTNTGTSPASAFKTIGKALSVVAKSTVTGLTITLAPGQYSTKSGEVFPIAIPTAVVLAGNGYGHGPAKGAFVNGFGEDTKLEKALGKPPRTLFATFVIPSGISATLDKLYIGTTAAVPVGYYASTDVFGTLSASQDTFSVYARSSNIGGIVVPSGTLTCVACFVIGPDYAIKAFTVPGYSTAPSIDLTGPGQSVIAGGDGLRTDGTATITAAAQVFQSRNTAYTDSLAVPSSSPGPTGSPAPSPTGSGSSSGSGTGGSVDFGYGAQNSAGGNTFVGSNTEIAVALPGAQVIARNNTWNVIARGPQRTNAAGQYPKTIVFRSGSSGRNVKIASNAGGAVVVVGPPPAPTPSPSPTPSGSPSPTPTASAT